jgi:DNA-binding response OmpR family regulator
MKNLRILIIDTDLFSLSKTYFGLIHLEHAVEACNNLQEVEERVERFQPGLVIVGNTGPGDAASLCRYLKVQGVHLLLLGRRAEVDLSTLPVDGVLEKPVDVNLLRRTISELAA